MLIFSASPFLTALPALIDVLSIVAARKAPATVDGEKAEEKFPEITNPQVEEIFDLGSEGAPSGTRRRVRDSEPKAEQRMTAEVLWRQESGRGNPIHADLGEKGS